MKLKKSEISEIIREVLDEETIKINKQDMEKLHKGETISKNGNEIEYDEEGEVEEGLAGGLAGAALAQGDVLRMAAGGYFGSKVQDYINKKLKKKDNESK
tara:strand:+ start:13 stop:312 length:300 start_codon:yes stop_codon:yes gene_type:complete